MPKKCLICGETAKYFIKGTSDFYCEDCAVDHFGDVNLLESVEEYKHSIKREIVETEDGFIKTLSPQEEEDLTPEEKEKLKRHLSEVEEEEY